VRGPVVSAWSARAVTSRTPADGSLCACGPDPPSWPTEAEVLLSQLVAVDNSPQVLGGAAVG
jgi:hypothetical protein